MSINSLATLDARTRIDQDLSDVIVTRAGQAPRETSVEIPTGSTQFTQGQHELWVTLEAGPSVSGKPQTITIKAKNPPTPFESAYKTFTNYIPSEMILVYTAALNVKTWDFTSKLSGILIFSAITFILVYILTAQKAYVAKKERPFLIRFWTFAHMTLSACSFFAWAFATPYVKNPEVLDPLKIFALVIVSITVTILGSFERDQI